MGMQINTKENFTIAEDGTIKRSLDSIDKTLLDIIRVAAGQNDTLAAYKARKRCYEVCKSVGKADYEEYVDKLQSTHFPNECKKAELGKRYVSLLMILALTLCAGFGGLMFFSVIIARSFTFLFFSKLAWLVYIIMGLVAVYVIKELKAISESIKSIK